MTTPNKKNKTFKAKLKLGVTCLAVTAGLMLGSVMSASDAHADHKKNRLTSSEVNRFVAEFNTKMASPNPTMGVGFLEEHLSPNLLVTNRYKNFATRHVQQVYHTYHGGYSYRYPTAYYTPYTSIQYSYANLAKPQLINDFARKKQSWAGYKPVMNIQKTDFTAGRSKAFVRVTLNEYALSYNPTMPQLYGRSVYSAASCELTLQKSLGDIQIENMSCEYSNHHRL